MTLFRRRDPSDPTPLWRRYLRFHRPDVDADVEDELRFHLEMSAADLERRGHSRVEAERVARARFGDVSDVRRWLLHHDRTRQHREERADTMDAILLDLKYAARRLRHQPAFTLGVVLVLGLGIGAATTMFSAVDAALLRPLPFQHDDRLVTIVGPSIHVREFGSANTSAQIEDVRAMRYLFTHVAAYAPGGLNLSDVNAPVRLKVALVTPDLFATLGVPVARGRGFTDEEGRPDASHVALLSDGLWRRQFGADAAIIGRDVRLNDVPYRVVGVMPQGFGFPEATDVWLPLTVPSTISQYEAFRSYMPTTFVGRLAPGVAAARAEAAVATLVERFRKADNIPDRYSQPATVQPLRDALVGKRRTALLVLLGATGLVLLVACANVTNLLLSRAIAQRSELALRAALGASRSRIVRQLLVESVLLACAGGTVGVVLAYLGTSALGALMPSGLAGAAPARVDARVLAFSVVVALLTGLAAGLWPALGASRTNASEMIKSGAPSGTMGREGTWTRRTFVVAELALALMLAVGSALMLRSLQSLLAVDAGVRPESVATLELTLPGLSYGTQGARRQFYDDVIRRVLATPGVEHAAVVNELPLRGKSSIAVTVAAEGHPRAPDAEPSFAQLLQTTTDYFQTLGIPLLRGGSFTVPFDSARGQEVVINESLAKQLWPGQSPIGQRLESPFPGKAPVVVGVVGDVRPSSIEADRMPQMYFDLARSAPNNAAILARGTLEPRVLAARLRDAVRAVNPTLAVYNVRPMTDVISGAIAPRRTNTYLITLFGVVAVLLAAIGVYGVIAYGVARRTREIGIRMALGARRGNVIGLVVSEGIVLAVVGVSIGLAGAWALRRLLASLLYGVTPSDPAAYVGAAIVLLVVAVLAALMPARRALRVDPALAIRSE